MVYYNLALYIKPIKMRLPVQAFLAGVFIRTFLGASLGVVDQDGQCMIWSNDNHACMSHSESVAQLNGTDGSGTV